MVAKKLEEPEENIFRVSMSRNFFENIAVRTEKLEKEYVRRKEEEITKSAAWKRHEDELNRYWKSKIALMAQQRDTYFAEAARRDHENREQKLQGQVDEVVSDLYSKHFRAPRREVECVSVRNQVEECYKQNAGNPLACRDLVQEYANCAAKVRQDYIKQAVTAN
eukprot:TRINITY_DN13326_c0_g1::TRINITY_DN13326_c0_g1_i1::g.9563::m.9563 TRINITY_DN13326_c0_g1::TRINITY_DN13326_c0_g1_i1::g.9563  ORF type:complete len:181 (-),score=31.54,CHCH/PF06747.8/0.0013,DUF1690/PF07956.6/0.02,Pet191_N/PF10203.4/0.16 TRINITY_DN13326_c0_g1_i1:471-965(-)